MSQNAAAKNLQKVPLWLAILINVNAVIGGAFFITAPKISRFAGYYTPVAWLAAAAILVPISIIFAQFASKLPHAGGIYVYSREAFGKLQGFMTGWMYFIGNSAGNALFVYAFCQTVLNIPIFFSIALKLGINQLGLGLLVTLGLTFLSMGGERLLARTQLIISWLKIIPFIAIILSLFSSAKISNFMIIAPQGNWFSAVLPLVIFSYIGIEACSSIAHTIQDGSKNVARATYAALFLVAIIYATTHSILNFSMGTGVFEVDAFARLGWILGNHIGSTSANFFYNFIMVSIGISYIGGAYSLLNTDCWLLYSMISDFSSGAIRALFTKLNEHGQPSNCLLLQGLLIGVFLIFAHTPEWMTIASVFGALLAFTTIIFAYIKIIAVKKKHFLVATFALISASIMGKIVLQEFYTCGILNMLPMIIIIGSGLALYFVDKNLSPHTGKNHK